MEGISHYDDPTAGWPDPEHTTLQQAVAALAAAAAAQDQHGLHHHHHHHHPFGDLGDSNNGPDVSRAPGNVGQHDHHNNHDSITLAGAAAAAGGMNMPLNALDLGTHSQLPPFPHHLSNSGFSMPGSHMQMQMQMHMPMHPSADILAAEAAAVEAKKREKKERKKREREEAKRQRAEADRQAIANSQPSLPPNTQLQVIRPEEAMTINQTVSNSAAGPSRIPAIPTLPRRARSAVSQNDPSDAIVRRGGNGGQDGPITDVNVWLAGSWLKGPALRKVAKEKGVDLGVHLRKGKFTSQEEKLVDDAITEYLGSRGLTRERDLTRMLFGGDDDPLVGDGEAGGNDGAGGTQGSRTRAKNKDRVDLVKAIAPCIPGRPLTSINAFIVRKYDPYVRKGPWTSQEDADLLRAYQQYGPAWDKISRIVERNETDCRVRYTNHLQIKQTRKRGLWSAEEEDMLQRTIAEVCKAAKTTLKDTPNRPVPWAVVVKMMGGQRNALECREKWFDQVLPRLMAQEQAGTTSASQPASRPASPAENVNAEASTSASGPTPISKLPRAMEWTPADFIHLLRRIAEVLGPDLSQVYQRDINFRTLHALTPDLQKFSYKHCYKTFRAYAKRVDGFEIIPLSELLPKLEGIVSSKFRSGGPRILRRTRASPAERVTKETKETKETKSQEMIEDEDDDSATEPESHDTPLAGDAFDVENTMEPALNNDAMTSEIDQHMQLDDSMIDPALMDLADNTVVEGLLSPQNITLAGAAAESATAAEAEPAVSQDTDNETVGIEQFTGRKRKHDEDGEKKTKKRSKKDKANDQAQPEEQSSAFTPSVAGTSNASTVSSENMEVADQIVEELTEEEKQKRKEEKRQRKEERRARKEAKRQVAALGPANPVVLGDDVAIAPE